MTIFNPLFIKFFIEKFHKIKFFSIFRIINPVLISYLENTKCD